MKRSVRHVRRKPARLLALTGMGVLIAAFFAAAATSAPATQFTVAAPPTVTAGVPFNVTVTAVDGNGNKDNGYKFDHNLQYSGPSNSPAPAPNGTAPIYQANPAVFTQGQASVQITLYNAAATTLTVAEIGTTITGSTGFTVEAGDPASLTFSQQPPVWVQKAPSTFAAKVTVKDAWGNLVPNEPVSVSLAGGANGAILTCDSTYCTEGPLTAETNSSGVAAFLLAVNNDSAGYHLVASAGPPLEPNANSTTFKVGDEFGKFTNGNGPKGQDAFGTTLTSTSVTGAGDNSLGIIVDASVNLPPTALQICGIQTQVGSGTIFEGVADGTSALQPTWTITATVKKAALIDTNRGAALYELCLGTVNTTLPAYNGIDPYDCVPNANAGAPPFSTSYSWPAKNTPCATYDSVSKLFWGTVPNAPTKVKNCSQAKSPVVLSKNKAGSGDLVIVFCVTHPWDGWGSPG